MHSEKAIAGGALRSACIVCVDWLSCILKWSLTCISSLVLSLNKGGNGEDRKFFSFARKIIKVTASAAALFYPLKRAGQRSLATSSLHRFITSSLKKEWEGTKGLLDDSASHSNCAFFVNRLRMAGRWRDDWSIDSKYWFFTLTRAMQTHWRAYRH